MTRDYFRPAALSATDELLRGMISDVSHVARETRDISIKSHAHLKELRYDHMHLSQQVVGLTDRMWRQEEWARRQEAAVKQLQQQMASQPPPKEREGLLWVLRQVPSRIWDWFSPKEKLTITGIVISSLLGLYAPKEIQVKLLDLFGLQPTKSAERSSGASSPP